MARLVFRQSIINKSSSVSSLSSQCFCIAERSIRVKTNSQLIPWNIFDSNLHIAMLLGSMNQLICKHKILDFWIWKTLLTERCLCGYVLPSLTAEPVARTIDCSKGCHFTFCSQSLFIPQTLFGKVDRPQMLGIFSFWPNEISKVVGS